MKNPVISLACEHGLSLCESSLIVDESGLDFQVVFATDASGDEWVLRLPRRQDVVPRTRVEKLALDLVHRQGAAFETPVWEICSDRLIAYRKLRGVPAGTIDPQARAYVWAIDAANVPDCFHQTLGKTLASLHRIPVDKAAEAGLIAHTAEEARSSMKNRMDAVKNAFGVGISLWSRWQAWLDNDPLWPEKTGLTHGDLHPGHILVDEKACVTGLIDWTEAKATDVSGDFVAHLRVFGEVGLASLLREYEEAGGQVWPGMSEHIIELAAAHPVEIAEFALLSGLDDMRDMARQSLEINGA